jgi:hypothetical protein
LGKNAAGRFPRQPVFLGRIFLLPILVQRINDLGELGAVFDLFQQFQRGEILDAVWREDCPAA